MNRLEAFVALNMVGGIGSVRIKSLLDYFSRPEDIFNAPMDKLLAVPGIGEGLACRLVAFKKESLAQEFKLARKSDLKIITIEDGGYPENLKNIPGPAIVLYIKGELSIRDNLALGIVGSRRASFYGLSAAARFASELAGRGFTIVSGLARGIDTASHRAALGSGGRTLAVMGSGFNNVYPVENKELAEEISRSGAVISEFPINEPPLKENFPRRNRLISGLSLGILVAEAAKNSGALITADFALEQGREVFALPGKIDSSGSFGTHALIKQGAKLVTDVEDILEEFDLENVPLERGPNRVKYDLNDEEENRLYALITPQAIAIDELVEEANMDIRQLSGVLLRLQIRKLIRQLPGKRFARCS